MKKPLKAYILHQKQRFLVFEIYFFSLKTKANPSPKGNGFVFTLFGDPYGFLPLNKGKANESLRGVCGPTLVDRTQMGSAIHEDCKKKTHSFECVCLFW